jgi:hypothetical protein
MDEIESVSRTYSDANYLKKNNALMVLIKVIKL